MSAAPAKKTRHCCRESFNLHPKTCPCCGGRLLVHVYRYTANYADRVRKKGKVVGVHFYKRRETERTRYCRRCQMSVEYNIGPDPSED